MLSCFLVLPCLVCLFISFLFYEESLNFLFGLQHSAVLDGFCFVCDEGPRFKAFVYSVFICLISSTAWRNIANVKAVSVNLLNLE